MPESSLIVDSGPLIAFARIEQLALLPQLSSHIVIPPAVWHEVTIRSSNAPGAHEVRQLSWLEIQTPDALLVAPLTILLDQGEAEVIALAQTLSDSMVVLDDARARRVAERLNIARIGTVGLLRRAKRMGLIPLLRPQLEALQANGIYIRQALIDAVLKDVGEA
jgi:predicted nucleic acid-binding protein